MCELADWNGSSEKREMDVLTHHEQTEYDEDAKSMVVPRGG